MKIRKSFSMVTFFLILGSSNASTSAEPKVYDIQVTEQGFEPASLVVTAGVPIVLSIKRTTEQTCATEVQVPDKKIKVALPLGKSVRINLGKLKRGDIHFGCGMGMMISGVITAK